MASTKEGFSEFISGIKEDKKKLFFVIIIPLVLIVSIILGIVLSGNDSPQIVNNENNFEGVINPVDSTAIKKNRNKTSSQIYKESFWTTEEKKEVDFFGDEHNSEDIDEVEKPIIEPTGGTYKYKSPYETPPPVKKEPKVIEAPIEVFDEADKKRRRAPSDSYGNISGEDNSISTGFLRAVIANDNKLVKSGSYVSIRLGEDIVIDGMTLPRNTIVTGITSFRKERMDINITNVSIGNKNKVVNWAIYDNDGVKGIMVPESILNSMATDVVDEGLDKGSSIGTNVPILGSVKVNLSKKNRDLEFVLNSGHKVFIKSIK